MVILLIPYFNERNIQVVLLNCVGIFPYGNGFGCAGYIGCQARTGK